MTLRVVPPPRDSLPAGRKLLLAAEILTTYARVRWLMRDEDAVRAMPRIRGGATRARRFAGTPEQAYLAGLRLGRIVGRTLAPLPSDSRCLFRSLTLTALLERRGIHSTVVIAVRPQPFAAHAWVEHAGFPLLAPGREGFERVVEL